jgi:hypothetical protein
MFGGFTTFLLTGLLTFAALPTSSSYQLHDYGVGTGGTSGSSSSQYSLEGISGETSGTRSPSTTYVLGSGEIYTQQANVPPAPTFTNSSSWYNKLHFVINLDNHPSDAKFAIAISSDNFTTTQYIQNDNTVGSALGPEDYQTYTNWGSGTGEDVIGLLPATTYKIKVKATTGKFTESAYSPEASAATVNPSMTFDIDVASTDTDTDPPFAINFGSLLAGTVITSSDRIWLDYATNGATGGNIYILADNAGLTSTAATHTIAAGSVDLSAVGEGFGVQSASVTQTSGGPITAAAPYNGGTNNVGIVDTQYRPLYTSSSAIVGGRTSLYLKAKASTDTPSAIDYVEKLTLIAASNF